MPEIVLMSKVAVKIILTIYINIEIISIVKCTVSKN